MVIYTSRDGDMVDKVCHDWYGDKAGAYESVLRANPGLAAQPMPLPAGIDIRLPDLPDNGVSTSINLFD